MRVGNNITEGGKMKLKRIVREHQVQLFSAMGYRIIGKRGQCYIMVKI